MEQFALFPWLIIPAQTTPAIFDEASQHWNLCAKWWTPHVFTGWVVVGENPKGTGWLISGQVELWFFLGPVYKWLANRVLGWYCDQMIAVMNCAEVDDTVRLVD